MPSDEMVEKARKRLVAMADDPARRVNEFTVMVDLADLRALALSAAHAEPVAWMDDGTLRAGSTATAHRVVTHATKLVMPRAVADSFTVPLYAPPSEAAIRADERAATCKEGLQVEEIRQAILDHCWGDSNGNVNGSILAAEAIATAIRARGER